MLFLGFGVSNLGYGVAGLGFEDLVENLEDWTKTMFPRCKPNHSEAIRLRVAEVETIKESLYANASAPRGSQTFLPSEMTTQEANEAIRNLFA